MSQTASTVSSGHPDKAARGLDLDPARAEELRSAMVRALCDEGVIASGPVAAAFAAVPRHLFAPRETLEAAYAPHGTVMPKRGEDGLLLSVLSAPNIQAMMLQPAGIEPGMRVLEIGCGVNAALIAELAGPGGQMTTMDIFSVKSSVLNFWLSFLAAQCRVRTGSPEQNQTARPNVVDYQTMKPTPQLSMLWESDDPEEALSQRFGFANAGSAVGWMGDTLWDTWAIAVDDCDRLVISGGKLLAWITADDRRLIAKWSVASKLFQRLADTTTLTMWLHHRGIPVAAPIPAKDGRLRVELDNVSLGVIPVIDGDLLDVGDPAQVTEAGRMLATLHDAMTAYPHHIGGGPSARHEQLVHNDFRSANVLHDGTGITAVLDFEEVTYRSRVSDLAKATALLGTRYHDWGPTSQLVREAFVGAYCGQAPLTNAEQNQLQSGIKAVMKHFGWA